MKQNVGDNERLVSAIAGSGLITYGISKGGLFGTALSLIGGGLLYRGATGHCHMYSAIDKTTATDVNTRVHVQRSVTINRSQAELYQFWRNFENLPQFMNHLESVTVLDDKRSHWKAKAPLGMTVEWDAEATGEVENERISWHSVEGSEIPNSGVVEFRPTTNRGTEVRVTLTYEPPAGKLGSWIAWMFGEEPTIQVAEDLRRFKALMEAGSIMRVDGQPSGRIAEVAEEKAKTKSATA
ncbi:MAG TPA: SRPBCC family protein [Pyrinomonadaceae bacterium]